MKAKPAGLVAKPLGFVVARKVHNLRLVVPRPSGQTKIAAEMTPYQNDRPSTEATGNGPCG